MDLQGKNALVTGAARRVGSAIARSLAERGVNLVIHCSRSIREAESLARDLRARHGVQVLVLRAGLDRVAEVERLAEAALQKLKTVHVLVNNASIYEQNEFGQTSENDWNKHLDANLRAPFFLAQALAPAMRRAGTGRIVNIADWAGLRPQTDHIPYYASKAGLLCLNTALAKALAPDIHVNAVLPGPVLLPEGCSRQKARRIAKATLLKRVGTPEDVARAVVFLCESDFITGAALPVDGGRLVA